MFLMKESLPWIRRRGRVVNLGSVVARQGESVHVSISWAVQSLFVTVPGIVI
jgi:NAD(P)-dependent dehydrogenase (short-subunit alcohol dehydrogenase family)